MTTDAAYYDLISEAFIDPIRSVLIVDDDYPTLNEILAEGDEKKAYTERKKKWREDPDQVRKVINEFRNPNAPFLLDIHDGKLPDEKVDEEGAEELQQTDLLILDYQLEPGVDNGYHALRIARRALSNEHFNLILVHTENPIGDVFYEFVIGLNEPRFQNETAADDDEHIDAFEDEYGDDLSKALTLNLWAVALLKPADWTNHLCGTAAEWNEPRLILEEANKSIEGFNRGKWRGAVMRALAAKEAELPQREEGRPIQILDWKGEGDRFIRTDRGFMSFKSKQDDPETPLIDTIRSALCAWCPRPSRLLLTKLRAEMNRRGIEVQDDALGEPRIGAIWYRDLLEIQDSNENETQASTAVDRTVRNHAEQLLDQILPGVRDFALKMIGLEKQKDVVNIVNHRFSIDLKSSDEERKAILGHNAFVGSKPVTGSHLELGHILRINNQFWICMTPACDLVPGREASASRPDKRSDLKRFTALRLYDSPKTDPLASATKGGRIFANIYDESGSITSKSFAMAFDDGAAPAWLIMYATSDGLLTFENDWLGCLVRHVEASDEGVIIVEKPAKIVGHLRLEYALDIQSRLGNWHSRIGLDHKNFPSSDVSAEKDDQC